MIHYLQNKASIQDIYNHLQKVSSMFTPSLEDRVNLNEYANKIGTKACTLCAFRDAELIGLLAYYLDDQLDEVYVTNMSVLKEFQGKGIASKLMGLMLQDVHVKGKSKIRLCAYSDNDKVIKFYKKQGFYLGRKIGDQNEMIYRADRTNPLVSICCVTYNHESYIYQCLEGFIAQRTDFSFEILIHDDASTDRTADIIREYETKYPDIIKPIYQTENQYSKGVFISATYNWSRAKGKYIALCEGDDYWIDPMKLQKQVDFLEAHPECGLVHTELDHYYTEKKKYVKNHWKVNEVFNQSGDIYENLLVGYKGSMIYACTACFRKELCVDNELYRKAVAQKVRYGDLVLFAHIASVSLIGYIDESTAVRRVLKHSVTQGHSFSYYIDRIGEGKKILDYFHYNVRQISPVSYEFALENLAKRYMDTCYNFFQGKELFNKWYLVYIRLSDNKRLKRIYGIKKIAMKNLFYYILIKIYLKITRKIDSLFKHRG